MMSRQLALGAAVAGVLMAGLSGATAAFGADPSPWWRLSSTLVPSYPPPGGEGKIILTATNLGDAETDGSREPVTITDKLPPGLEATAVHGYFGFTLSEKLTGSGLEFPCEPPPIPPLEQVLECTFVKSENSGRGELNLSPYGGLTVIIAVKVNAPPGTVKNEAKVEGGGAPRSVSVSRGVTVSSAQAPFGVESYELTPEDEGGSPDTQAGSHPFQLTTTFNLNNILELDSKNHQLEPSAPALLKDLHFELPPGLIGNATALPQCSEADFFADEEEANSCPADAAVGVAQVAIFEPATAGSTSYVIPLFNLVPAVGEPARFGFEVPGVHVPILLDTSVRTGGDYGVTVSVDNASQIAVILGSQVTFWGVPGDSIHDISRGWECVNGEEWSGAVGKPCTPNGEQHPQAFLTLPTSCTGRSELVVSGDSWPKRAKPEGFELSPPPEPPFMEALNGCGELPFSPLIGVTTPESRAASTPTGLNVDVDVPQQTTLEAKGKAEADVKETEVVLPEGMQASPGAAAGLLTCSAAQLGFDGGGVEGTQLENNHFSPEAVSCPDASKIGTVRIKTPLLSSELTGSVYFAEQDTNPFISPLVLYLVSEDPLSGVRVKLAGEVRINETTGQLVSVFKDTPQLPFEELELALFGGPRATISTPTSCGSHTTTSSFAPWSGGSSASPSASFNVETGPGGGPCTGSPPPFAPSFQAGSTNTQAAAFTPFALTLEHSDGDQALSGLTMHLPPGVAALLSSVTPCAEPQAARNECGLESLIGYSTASSGLGLESYTLPGSVYLTGPYKDAPFGLSIVTPAVAGPFNLGDVTVRSTISIDPSTAAVTITSDPFPTIIKGVPVQLKQLNVTIDRAGFQFNPTNCHTMAITGTLTGAQGSSEGVSYPFQATNCASLPFAPKLTASAGGHVGKAGGASLDVKITSAGLGQANIHKVDLTLPKALPSRLTTLHKACLEAVFDANPAACDAGSVIGTAIVRTPILKSPLRGPAYLVSHGGAAFPDVEFVLQGEGITLIIDGTTDIKAGITYSKFETAPDAPFTTFEAVLPTGPYSVFTANVPMKAKYSLCGTSLAMPTEITGQNGAVIKQSTKIAVTGCAKVKKLTRAQKLEKALRACKTYRKKAKRAKCKKQALKQYGRLRRKPPRKGVFRDDGVYDSAGRGLIRRLR